LQAELQTLEGIPSKFAREDMEPGRFRKMRGTHILVWKKTLCLPATWPGVCRARRATKSCYPLYRKLSFSSPGQAPRSRPRLCVVSIKSTISGCHPRRKVFYLGIMGASIVCLQLCPHFPQLRRVCNTCSARRKDCLWSNATPQLFPKATKLHSGCANRIPL